MKYHTPLIIAALLASLFTGCSKHSPAATGPKVTDLGVVEISDGTPVRRDLDGGKVCVITPTVTTNGSGIFVRMAVTIEQTDSAGTVQNMECPPVAGVAGKPVEFRAGDINIRLTTEIKP